MATFNGTEGNDTLIGGAAADDLHGFGGNDFMQGGDGADTVLGDGGNDTLSGNGGNDWVRGGTGNDQVSGGGGQDTFAFHDFGATNADTLTDFAGNWDAIGLDRNAFTNLGASGRFVSGDARFRLGAAAQDTDDRIVYNQATGQLWYDADGSGAGAAQLIATLSNRAAMSATDIFVFQSSTPPPPPGTINGTSGDDTLVGTSGPDTINGLGGNDSLIGNSGADVLNGGDGNDTMDARTGSEPRPTPNDTLDGGLGDDTFMVWHGTVVLDAGGHDTIIAELDGEYTMPGGIEDLIVDRDSNDNFGITGNDLGNLIVATSAVNRISGLGGNDSIDAGMNQDQVDGGAGDDTIYGGNEFNNEQDILTGGAGADHFVMAAPAGELVDQITDFVSGTDKLRFDGNLYTNIGASGNFVPADPRFHYGTAAFDASDRIIFNSSTGELFYDSDGTGAQAQVLIASNLPLISATDIEVVNGTAPGNSMVGTEGNDSLVGTAANDTIDGLGGNDTIRGLGGDDRLVGGNGADSVAGGDGNDTLIGHDGFAERGATWADTLDGGLGDDVYIVNFSDAVLADSGGADSVFADTSWMLGAGLENLRIEGIEADGSSGFGNELSNTLDLSGLEHYGTIEGRGGNDLILAGQKEMTGSRISGGEGNDTIRASTTAGDRIFGDGGNDSIVGYDSFRDTADFDTIDGGTGNDTIDATGTFAFSAAPGAANADLLVHFTSGWDTIQLDATVMPQLGGSGRFTAGDARFWTGSGAHDADDRIIFNSATGQLWYDADGNGGGAQQLIATIQSGSVSAADITVVNGGTPPPPPPPDGTNGTEGNDTMIGTAGADTLNGLGGNDFMQGGDGSDTMRGGAGNDTMSGNGGNDWVEGGAGNDQVSGGGGQDAFVFREFGTTNADRLTDFASNWDSLRTDNAAFTALGGDGRFASGDARFRAGTAAADADDRIVWNSATGQVWYDADGNGGGSAQLVATLQAGATLVASDIWVI